MMQPRQPSTGHVEGVPIGPYCYELVPAPESGFSSIEEIEKHLAEQHGNLFSGDAMNEFMNLTVPKHCRFWNPTEHGFVECTHLHLKALYITTTEAVRQKAIAFSGSEEELNRNIDGYLLGDAVKECRLNPDRAAPTNGPKPPTWSSHQTPAAAGGGPDQPKDPGALWNSSSS